MGVTSSVTARVVAGATFASTLTAAPVFFLGAMAIPMGSELGFGDAGLGVAVATFWAASALTAVPGGRLVEVVGGPRALAGGTILSGLAIAAVGLLVHSWAALLAMMVVAGIANGTVGPAAGSVLARGVPHQRQGLAFGIKQSAPPLAGLCAGLAVPGIALTVGWRWAFALAGVSSLLVLMLPRGGAPPRRSLRKVRRGDAALGPLLLLAAASGFGAVVAASMSTFLVGTTVEEGLTEEAAGLLLAAGSLLAIATRLAVGRMADRRGGRLLVLAGTLVLIGAVGLAILAAGRSLAVLLIGTVLAFGPGWGWNGLVILAVVRSNANAPGAAAGIVLAGGTTGAVVGPLVFAWMLSHASVAAGWWMTSAAAALCSAMIFAARYALRRDVHRRQLNAGTVAAALESA